MFSLAQFGYANESKHMYERMFLQSANGYNWKKQQINTSIKKKKNGKVL